MQMASRYSQMKQPVTAFGLNACLACLCQCGMWLQGCDETDERSINPQRFEWWKLAASKLEWKSAKSDQPTGSFRQLSSRINASCWQRPRAAAPSRVHCLAPSCQGEPENGDPTGFVFQNFLFGRSFHNTHQTLGLFLTWSCTSSRSHFFPPQRKSNSNGFMGHKKSVMLM